MKPSNLMDAIRLFQLQGFKTPEEMFLIGYIMAHGGELYQLGHIKHDFQLIAHNPEFWQPIVDGSHDIRVKVAKEEVQAAHEMLLTLLETRNAKVPEWLQKVNTEDP
jgi:hypothetical protein